MSGLTHPAGEDMDDQYEYNEDDDEADYDADDDSYDDNGDDDDDDDKDDKDDDEDDDDDDEHNKSRSMSTLSGRVRRIERRHTCMYHPRCCCSHLHPRMHTRTSLKHGRIQNKCMAEIESSEKKEICQHSCHFTVPGRGREHVLPAAGGRGN